MDADGTTKRRARRRFPSPLGRGAPALLAALVLAGCPGPEPTPRWSVVLDGLGGALLSVHGTSATDVWTVGGARPDAAGLEAAGPPNALHFDGSAWTQIDFTGAGVPDGTDFWWVHAFDDGTVMIGGEGGTIVRRAPGASAFERMTTPGTGTVFGVWGSTSGDVWAVGGLGGSAGFVWRFDGSAWTDVALPAGHPGAAVFKVWGTSSSDVWLCGLMGTLMHWDGAALSMVTSPTTRSLFTVHTDGEDVVAVGGAGSGVVVEAPLGGAFADVTPDLAAQMNGVWLTGDGRGWAVGFQGDILERTGPGAWVSHDPVIFVGHDLHAVWVDPSGGVWAVGGEILSEPLVDGVLVHRGTTVIPSTIVGD